MKRTLTRFISRIKRRKTKTEAKKEGKGDDGKMLEELAAALERLPAELTDVIVLHYYDNLSLLKIAETLGISCSVIKKRHNKALSLLRSVLV